MFQKITWVKNTLSPTLFLLFLTAAVSAQTAVQPAKERVLMMEEFNNNANKTWPEINHGDTAFAKIENGNYILDAKKADRFWALRLGIPAPLPAQPDIMEMKMKAESDSPRMDYGILWHTSQVARSVFNEYSFFVSSDGSYTISKKENGRYIYIKEWTSCSCVHIKDYNVLRIEQSGNNFKFFVNGQAVFQGPLTDGGLSTMGFYSDAHSILSIDYIKLAVRESSP